MTGESHNSLQGESNTIAGSLKGPTSISPTVLSGRVREVVVKYSTGPAGRYATPHQVTNIARPCDLGLDFTAPTAAKRPSGPHGWVCFLSITYSARCYLTPRDPCVRSMLLTRASFTYVLKFGSDPELFQSEQKSNHFLYISAKTSLYSPNMDVRQQDIARYMETKFRHTLSGKTGLVPFPQYWALDDLLECDRAVRILAAAFKNQSASWTARRFPEN